MKMIGKFKQTDEAFYFETNSFPDELGKPPKEFDANKFIARLPFEICKRQILEDEAIEFFCEGKTNLIEDFISKRGKPFKAKLFLKSNGKFGFEFEPRAIKEPKDKPI